MLMPHAATGVTLAQTPSTGRASAKIKRVLSSAIHNFCGVATIATFLNSNACNASPMLTVRPMMLFVQEAIVWRVATIMTVRSNLDCLFAAMDHVSNAPKPKKTSVRETPVIRRPICVQRRRLSPFAPVAAVYRTTTVWTAIKTA